MRRVLGYLMIWCGATALAISLAWFGVRDVLRAEVTDTPYPGVAAAGARTGRPPTPTPPAAPASRPKAGRPVDPASGRPPAADPSPTGPAAKPSATNTATSPAVRPPATTSAPRTPGRTPAASRTPAREPATSPRQSPAATRTRPAPRPSSEVKVVNVKGGQVSFAIENGECRLLSATPAAGYEARVSGNVGWIRVDLMRGDHGSSVFCTWHGHAPATDVYEF